MSGRSVTSSVTTTAAAALIVAIGILSSSLATKCCFAFNFERCFSTRAYYVVSKPHEEKNHGRPLLCRPSATTCTPSQLSSSSSSNNDSSSSSSSSSTNQKLLDDVQRNAMKLGENVIYECNEVASILGKTLKLSWKQSVSAQDIVRICDEIDAINNLQQNVGKKVTAKGEKTYVSLTSRLNMEQRALRYSRQRMLVTMMKENYDTYVTIATFLSNRIPRRELPNVQDIPYPELLPPAASAASNTATSPTTVVDESGIVLVSDCSLNKVEFAESILDKFLLRIFRDLVEINTGGIRSDKPGIQGLVEQARNFMVQEGQTPEAMHKMVYDTLGGLMTPYLPPFYRIFMSGIIPKGLFLGLVEKDQTLGPWFYAPWLTSIVTPTFFGFLVGPSYPNTRKDGQPGGLLVEKCKFLQESSCKGLCLHECKIPAQKVRFCCCCCCCRINKQVLELEVLICFFFPFCQHSSKKKRKNKQNHNLILLLLCFSLFFSCCGID